MDIAIIFGCWAISFLFSGIETGLLSVDPVRLRHQTKRNIPAAIQLNRLLEKPERLFVTVLLITNGADILGLLLLTRRFVLALGPIGFLAALLVAFPVYLFLLGVLPKSLFRRFPFRALIPMAGLLEAISLVFRPLLELGSLAGHLFLPRRARRRGRLFAAREELKQITTMSEHEGSLTATERALIHNVVDFRSIRVRDIMMPINKVTTVGPDTSVSEALKLSRAAGTDRLPVVARDGRPIGLVNALDILLEKTDTSRPLTQQMRRLVTATENEPAYRTMQRLRATRLGLAGVLDGKGKLRGTVSIEALIRRLVQSA